MNENNDPESFGDIIARIFSEEALKAILPLQDPSAIAENDLPQNPALAYKMGWGLCWLAVQQKLIKIAEGRK